MNLAICGRCAIKRSLTVPVSRIHHLWSCEYCGIIPLTAVLNLDEEGLLLLDPLLDGASGSTGRYEQFICPEQVELPPSAIRDDPEGIGFQRSQSLIERAFEHTWSDDHQVDTRTTLDDNCIE